MVGTSYLCPPATLDHLPHPGEVRDHHLLGASQGGGTINKGNNWEPGEGRAGGQERQGGGHPVTISEFTVTGYGVSTSFAKLKVPDPSAPLPPVTVVCLRPQSGGGSGLHQQGPHRGLWDKGHLLPGGQPRGQGKHH